MKVEATPAALVQELMELYEARTMEDLSAKTGVSTRNLYRWKSGKGLSFENAVEFFRVAGWLRVDGEERLDAAQRERARRLATRVADDLQELARLLAQ